MLLMNSYVTSITSIIDDLLSQGTNRTSYFPYGPLNTQLSKIHGLFKTVCSCMFKHYNCLSADSEAEE